MQGPDFTTLAAEIGRLTPCSAIGTVAGTAGGLVEVSGLGGHARIGDRIRIERAGPPLWAEVLRMDRGTVLALPEQAPDGLATGDRAVFVGPVRVWPSPDWIGRVIDAQGAPLDGRALGIGSAPRAPVSAPPDAMARKPLGARLATGVAVFDTFLPIVAGQRIGLFAGSGVGKTTLIAALTRGLRVDLAVVALIGERGREVSEFVHRTLGKAGMKRAIVVAATSDRSGLEKRRAAQTAMAVAEFFRDMGAHVALVMDSITRFADAHRDVALLAGEAPGRGGYPGSTAQMVTELVERAGPGAAGTGDITAIFSVLVPGSDMEDPVADLMRGVLDGHAVLSRRIAERGRFPAIDVLGSVSRALPDAASAAENALLREARGLLAKHDEAELMIQSGLYVPGGDAELDRAVALFPVLDRFLGKLSGGAPEESFARLKACLHPPEPASADQAGHG